MRFRPLAALALLCLAPALRAQADVAVTRLNGRTEFEAGASFFDFQVKDESEQTRVSLGGSLAYQRWDGGKGSIRAHADALIAVDRWHWTLGPVLDFADAARPGVGARLSGGYEIFPHGVLALTLESITTPKKSDAFETGTHSALGLMFKVNF